MAVPQTVVVKSQETGKVIFGPRPVEKDSNIAKLQEKILEMRKQPWASMRFFYEERELDSETKLQSLLETSLTLMADVNSDSLDISVHKSYFNKFPDVITEIVVSQRKEEEFQDYVTTIREKLRPVCGRFRTNCSCVRGDIQSVDPAIVLKSIEDKPRNMSCVPFLSCLSSEEHGRVQAFLQKAKDARMWKHESFGQHYLLVWAAGHELRFSIISEDSESSRNFVSTMKPRFERFTSSAFVLANRDGRVPNFKASILAQDRKKHMEEAKALGEEIQKTNEAKQKVQEALATLSEKLRQAQEEAAVDPSAAQRAKTLAGLLAHEEPRLLQLFDEKRQRYELDFARLKELKREIGHLEHAEKKLETAVQSEFQHWRKAVAQRYPPEAPTEGAGRLVLEDPEADAQDAQVTAAGKALDTLRLRLQEAEDAGDEPRRRALAQLLATEEPRIARLRARGAST
ncbi:unnamed protein product [Effrenium voratum]|nr:unnamed protein product [Effrenium voratum]